MAQDERDYWYRPKEFRSECKALDNRTASSPSGTTLPGERCDSDVSWHWFEFILGFVVCIGLLLFFPDKMVQLLNYLSALIF
jgi:hypothetical protein